MSHARRGSIADSRYWQDLAASSAIDWAEVRSRLPFADDMSACLQDAHYHREGDVWTHTTMVVDQLCRLRESRGLENLGLTASRWTGLFLAALLHDIAKPVTRSGAMDTEGRSRVHHFGHSRIGALMAWEFLWRQGVERLLREQVFHLVRWHQRPFHLTFAPSLERDMILLSQVGNWAELLALAHADNLGRIAPNTAETAQTLDLLQDEIRGRGCLDNPWPFATDTARVWFARQDGRSAYFDPPAPAGSRVVVLSGLPGAGKDMYCRSKFPDWPVVSLDAWRSRLGIGPGDPQGRVIQAAMEEARGHLRAKQRFVWNATNVSRLNRDKAVGLCLDYDAHVEIHAFDTPPERLRSQNRNRQAEVPEAVIDRLLMKWEPPSILEAHAVVWVE